MARKVFFSFKFKEDNWRVGQIRNIGQFEITNEFYDHAEYEKIKLQNEFTIKRWINKQLNGASVTCVLIGEKTHVSKWVDYEIRRSLELGKGVFGIYIHNLKDRFGNYSQSGSYPFSSNSPIKVYNPVSNHYMTAYESINNNLVDWVEAAAKQAGR
jgi:hypothetical protein